VGKAERIRGFFIWFLKSLGAIYVSVPFYLILMITAFFLTPSLWLKMNTAIVSYLLVDIFMPYFVRGGDGIVQVSFLGEESYHANKHGHGIFFYLLFISVVTPFITQIINFPLTAEAFQASSLRVWQGILVTLAVLALAGIDYFLSFMRGKGDS
jgi:hypothetical protein